MTYPQNHNSDLRNLLATIIIQILLSIYFLNQAHLNEHIYLYLI